MSVNSNNTGLALTASAWFFAGQVDGSEPARHVPIHSTPFRVGRNSNLPLALPCESVSKEHAEIYEDDGQLAVRDLNSTNGTYVNGKRVEGDAKIKEGDIVQFATVVFRVGREENSTAGGTIAHDSCDQALAMMQFDRLIHDGAVVPFFQPIVTMEENPQVIGFEALGRSRLFGLQTPAEMFTTASQLNLESELSRVLRHRSIEISSDIPADMNLFVNTHPIELADRSLPDSLQEMRKLNPDRKITLEIHEAAVTSPKTISELRALLNDLDIALAFDDFGAGQARLVELGEVRPDYLKFDIQLVHGIDSASSSRQQVVAALVKMVNDLGTIPLAEGVETEKTHETLCQMGFKLGQGYHYGRPSALVKCLDMLDRQPV